MIDAVEARSFLVDRFDDPPRRLRDVCVFEHYVLGLCVLLPACPGFHVHRTKFPLLERIMNAHHKSKLLLVITARDSRKRWARILFMFQNAVRRWPAHMGPSPAT